ncbi:endonuclease/exonuclease/phosphatase family protein [Rubrivirga sp.]|uniref:endonuclease/exonuclease/phosphatase family protein n=1 Tax=Rubrivirga sp. TaxID=1885344 RepID=UPI003B52D7ED
MATAVVGGIGLLARWSSPSAEWLPQVVAPALPVLGPLSLPFAVATGAVALRTRSAGGGVATLLLAAVFTAWTLRTSAPPSADHGPLRVMTLNLGESMQREGAVEDYVVQTRPHLLLLQESTFNHGPYAPAVGRLLTLGGYTAYKDSVQTEPGVAGPRRQVILSRLPVLDFRAGFLGAEEVHSGVYSRVLVAWEGAEVAVYNVHLRPFNPRAGWSADRMLDPSVWAQTPKNLRSFFAEHAVESEALARLVAAETGPVIVGGDFNAAPDQWGRAVLARTLRETTGRWLPGATRPDKVPLVNVDGIQVSDDWAVADAGVGPSGLSDHRPVSASLALRREPQAPRPRPDP